MTLIPLSDWIKTSMGKGIAPFLPPDGLLMNTVPQSHPASFVGLNASFPSLFPFPSPFPCPFRNPHR